MIQQNYIGVDIASKSHVAYDRQKQQIVEVLNTAAGIKKYLKSLKQPYIIGLEATGKYGHLFARLAFEAGHCIYMLQPGKIKNFRKSGPDRGKTDEIDAKVIANYVEAFQANLHPYQPLPEFEVKLRKLTRTKAALTDKVASIRLMLRDLGDEKRHIEKAVHGLVEKIKELDKGIKELLASDEKAQVLYSIPGVSHNLISAVLPALRTISFKSKYALDSYAGIDLVPNESGKFKGKRRISKQGDKLLRRAVYLTGFCGANSKVWKPYYQNLIENKKLKPVQAINALGRKVLHTVYGVYKTQTPFKPNNT